MGGWVGGAGGAVSTGRRSVTGWLGAWTRGAHRWQQPLGPLGAGSNARDGDEAWVAFGGCARVEAVNRGRALCTRHTVMPNFSRELRRGLSPTAGPQPVSARRQVTDVAPSPVCGSPRTGGPQRQSNERRAENVRLCTAHVAHSLPAHARDGAARRHRLFFEPGDSGGGSSGRSQSARTIGILERTSRHSTNQPANSKGRGDGVIAPLRGAGSTSKGLWDFTEPE